MWWLFSYTSVRRRRSVEYIIGRARAELIDRRWYRSLFLLVLALIRLSPLAALRILRQLVCSGYLLGLRRAATGGPAPAPIRVTGSLLPRHSNADCHLALSKVFAQLGLLEASFKSRASALAIGIASQTPHQNGHDLLGETLWSKSTISQDDLVTGSSDSSEELFQALVRGKHVLVVGGAKSLKNPDLVETMARAEVVVRLKDLGIGSSENACPNYPSDIVYHIPFSARWLSAHVRTSDDWRRRFPRSPKMLVFMGRSVEISAIGTDLFPLPVRLLPLKTMLLQGESAIGQRAVLDVLRYAPRSLHVVGFDGYLSPPQGNEQRRVLQYDSDFLRALKSFAGHDHLGNREILRSLLRRDLITVDKRTEEFLRLSDADYSQMLDSALRRRIPSPTQSESTDFQIN